MTARTLRHRYYWFCFVPAWYAQEDRAVITGTVTDPSQTAVPGATVAIASKTTGFHRGVKTNESGAFLLPGLLTRLRRNHPQGGFAPNSIPR
jgi:hypothetical protein